MSDKCPPMPSTEAEWRCHWAFYRLTVKERDYERIRFDRLKAEFDALKADR